MNMNTVTKFIYTTLTALGLSFASEIDLKQLEVHANECLDYLEAFTNPEFNPQKNIQKSYENGSLILQYNENIIAQTDKIAEKWIKDCGDLFISDNYAPSFFKNSPIYKVVTDRIKNQKSSKKVSNPNNESNSKEKNETFKLRATFLYGYLRDIDVITPYTTSFQYAYGGENLIWGKFDNEKVFASNFSEGSFTYSFSKSGDSISYTSPLKNHITENNGTNGWAYKTEPKIWKQKTASADVLKGNFTYKNDLFAAIPRGNIDHSWAIKMAASVGLHLFVYTNDMIKDNNWIKGSTRYVGDVGTLGFLIDISAGVVHCSPASGRCFGFGAGYSRNIFDGYVIDEDNSWYRHQEETNKFKITDNLKFYGEYYLSGKSPKGFRESIEVPLNAKMKYLTSKTGFFLGKMNRFEFGLEFSPIQYIPGIYIQYGFSFTTPALW